MKELYAPVPSVEQYLRRIGYRKTPQVTLACLNDLIHCQLHTVPFENLDVFYSGKVPSLGTDALFEKIIRQKRGGYCFELNNLFCRLLSAIGFDAFCVKVRILLGRTELQPMTHCAVLVALDGKKYYCDVGFGGPAPVSAIEMIDEPQISGNHRYCIKNHTLYLEQDGTFLPMMQFEGTPCDPVDFVPLNFFCAKSVLEPFVHKLMVSRKIPGGHVSIDGDILKLSKCGKVSETPLCSETEVQNALKTWFGINTCQSSEMSV